MTRQLSYYEAALFFVSMSLPNQLAIAEMRHAPEQVISGIEKEEHHQPEVPESEQPPIRHEQTTELVVDPDPDYWQRRVRELLKQVQEKELASQAELDRQAEQAPELVHDEEAERKVDTDKETEQKALDDKDEAGLKELTEKDAAGQEELAEQQAQEAADLDAQLQAATKQYQEAHEQDLAEQKAQDAAKLAEAAEKARAELEAHQAAERERLEHKRLEHEQQAPTRE